MAIHWSGRAIGGATTRWIAALFAIGATLFFVGPFPGYIQLVGSGADGITFFVGSLFFTSAAALQALQSQQGDRLATLVQFGGTIFFNVSTFRALQASIDTSEVNRLVWAPELAGSICFLVSGVLAYLAVRDRHSREWRIAAVNLAGCALFGTSSIASYVVPSSGSELDLAAANWTTSLGALCFLIGALTLLPPGGRTARDAGP